MSKSNEQYWIGQRRADEKVYELFSRILHEGPRADEYYAKDDWHAPRFNDRIGSDWDRSTGDLYSIVGPEHFGDLDWDDRDGVMRATIYPGDLHPEGTRKRIWIGPMFSPGGRGIWIANQYTRGVHHYFGLTNHLYVPGVVLHYGDNWGDGTERWHIHDTDDEVVAAAIAYIGRRR